MNPLSECSLASLSHISTPLPHSTNLMLVFLNWHTLGRVIGSQTYVSFLQISEIGSSLRELHWSVTVSWSEVVVYKICLDTSSGSKSHIYFVLGCFKIVWFQWNLSEEKAHLVVMVCLYGCWSYFHESHICTSPKTSTLPYCFSYCTLKAIFSFVVLKSFSYLSFWKKVCLPFWILYKDESSGTLQIWSLPYLEKVQPWRTFSSETWHENISTIMQILRFCFSDIGVCRWSRHWFSSWRGAFSTSPTFSFTLQPSKIYGKGTQSACQDFTACIVMVINRWTFFFSPIISECEPPTYESTCSIVCISLASPFCRFHWSNSAGAFTLYI